MGNNEFSTCPICSGASVPGEYSNLWIRRIEGCAIEITEANGSTSSESPTDKFRFNYCPDCASPLFDVKPYTKEQLKSAALENTVAWLTMDDRTSLVIITDYEWRQGHQTEWLLFDNHCALPIADYADEWELTPYYPAYKKKTKKAEG